MPMTVVRADERVSDGRFGHNKLGVAILRMRTREVKQVSKIRAVEIQLLNSRDTKRTHLDAAIHKYREYVVGWRWNR